MYHHRCCFCQVAYNYICQDLRGRFVRSELLLFRFTLRIFSFNFCLASFLKHAHCYLFRVFLLYKMKIGSLMKNGSNINDGISSKPLL